MEYKEYKAILKGHVENKICKNYQKDEKNENSNLQFFFFKIS